MSGVNAINRCS